MRSSEVKKYLEESFPSVDKGDIDYFLSFSKVDGVGTLDGEFARICVNSYVEAQKIVKEQNFYPEEVDQEFCSILHDEADVEENCRYAAYIDAGDEESRNEIVEHFLQYISYALYEKWQYLVEAQQSEDEDYKEKLYDAAERLSWDLYARKDDDSLDEMLHDFKTDDMTVEECEQEFERIAEKHAENLGLSEPLSFKSASRLAEYDEPTLEHLGLKRVSPGSCIVEDDPEAYK